jgi:hypothetical protein
MVPHALAFFAKEGLNVGARSIGSGAARLRHIWQPGDAGAHLAIFGSSYQGFGNGTRVVP